MKRRYFGALLVIATLVPAISLAQGTQTGTVTGVVTSTDGVVVPDAKVVVKSAALQGERAVVTDVNGVYLVSALPPGTYTVTIEKGGLSPVEMNVLVPLGTTASADATLEVAPRFESVVVAAATPPAVTAIQTSANITASEVNVLPMGRTPYLIAELMPGLTTNTPSPNQLTISGGFAFDNVFLIDGVDVNDNLIGSVNDLYIEDAIGEVQVLTSGISAEYRPLLRWCRQHRHEERWKSVCGQLPNHLDAPVVDDRDAVRGRQSHRARTTDRDKSVHQEQAFALQRAHGRRSPGS